MQRREFITTLGAAAAGRKRNKRPTTLVREAGYLLLGLVSLATVTGVHFWLDVPLVAAAFTYLVVLVLLSLVNNLSSLIVLSFIAVGCLSYFFAPPIYSFRVDYPQDIITISAFLITSFVVNFLVTRVRVERETLRDANQRLEITNGALRIENVERKRAEQALQESEDKLRQIMGTVPNLTGSTASEGKKAEVQPGFMGQVQAILNVIPAYTWYAAPSGGLTFVNKRTADYLGLPKDHPLRFGIDIGAPWDAHIPLLHLDDQEESRKAWSTCLRTGEAAEFSQRVRNAQGEYRWFLSRTEPLRADDGTLLHWVGVNLDIDELKCAGQALREAERSARSAIDGIAGLVSILAPNGEVETVNRQVFEYFGQSLEELKNWEATDAIHPEDLPHVVEIFTRARACGIPFQHDQRLRRFDGEYRWFENRGVPVRDAAGHIVRWYVLMTDIEDRKRADEALRESEAKIRRLVDSNVIGIFVWDFEGRFLEMNDEFLRTVGYDREDLLGGSIRWTDLTPPDWRDRSSARMEKGKSSGRFEPFETEYTRKDGSRVPVLIGGAPFEVGGNQGVAFVLDRTERKRAEQALGESETKFRDYAETASDWFWEMGPDYKFTLLTENAFGSRSADRIGTACWDHAIDLETEPEKWRLVWATLDAHESFRDFVYCALDGSGAPMYVKASGKPVFDHSGKFLGYRGTGTDVTAIVRGQRAEASLQTVQAELAHVSRVMTLGQLTASIAHEVNQPIGSARNNARAALNFLNRSHPDLDEVREALSCIVADADRAGGIIDRIRDQIKKVPPRSDPFDLNRAIEEVIGLAQSITTENGVSVQSRLASGMALVIGDRVQLQQVVLNLILNAVEAMKSVEADERRLLISTDQSEANGTLVAVRDSGPGIDPEHLELVFEAFYSTKSGMGMGLSICRSIIAAHGGRLWAAATEPGGALFQFTLPSVQSSVVRPFTMRESGKNTSL
jgi:PAS domain S-box-containing protein